MEAVPFLEEEIILLDLHQEILHQRLDRASLRLALCQGILIAILVSNLTEGMAEDLRNVLVLLAEMEVVQ
jgi:hypothetical protein